MYRKIRFEYQQDYTAKNLTDLNIDIQQTSEALISKGFVSSYKLTGNARDVKVMENYRNIKYLPSEFEVFKKVINAAADLNKVLLDWKRKRK